MLSNFCFSNHIKEAISIMIVLFSDQKHISSPTYLNK